MTLNDLTSISADAEEPVIDAASTSDDIDRIVPVIEFRDVELAFDEQVILDGINFIVRRGETKIVLGGSGSGKSTIINLILGLMKPDAGQVLVDGEDITVMDDTEMMRIRKKIGMVFQ